jgi:hypothetical protein
MPRITNPKGIAINNRGFIALSFLRLLIAFRYWKREGVRTGDTFAVKPEPKSMPPLSVWPGHLPLARHYSFRKCNNIDSSINVTSLGKDCCLIVDSFEKNYRDKKT